MFSQTPDDFTDYYRVIAVSARFYDILREVFDCIDVVLSGRETTDIDAIKLIFYHFASAGIRYAIPGDKVIVGFL